MNPNILRIGELGKQTGVDTETIRFYEKAGLLPKPHRSQNGYRAYGAEHVERLAFIRHCRALDIPLNDHRHSAFTRFCGPPHIRLW